MRAWAGVRVATPWSISMSVPRGSKLVLRLQAAVTGEEHLHVVARPVAVLRGRRRRRVHRLHHRHRGGRGGRRHGGHGGGGEGLLPPDDRLDAVTPEHRLLQWNLRERARARGVAREPHPAEVTAPPALRLGVPQVSGGNTGELKCEGKGREGKGREGKGRKVRESEGKRGE